MLNPINQRPQAPTQFAPIVGTVSPVYQSETDTSKPTFRIRFTAYSRVVSGRVVVNATSQNTGKKNIQNIEFLSLKGMKTGYTTRLLVAL